MSLISFIHSLMSFMTSFAGKGRQRWRAPDFVALSRGAFRNFPESSSGPLVTPRSSLDLPSLGLSLGCYNAMIPASDPKLNNIYMYIYILEFQ